MKSRKFLFFPVLPISVRSFDFPVAVSLFVLVTEPRFFSGTPAACRTKGQDHPWRRLDGSHASDGTSVIALSSAAWLACPPAAFAQLRALPAPTLAQNTAHPRPEPSGLASRQGRPIAGDPMSRYVPLCRLRDHLVGKFQGQDRLALPSPSNSLFCPYARLFEAPSPAGSLDLAQRGASILSHHGNPGKRFPNGRPYSLHLT